ncbi:hypothetical protein HID58_071737 [Brassica napus]|uniref:Uncharacterized protein n=2 Tax=Brassica TaxID=3705 RepID=A0ABQ7Z2L8_BRANA|nr:FCS-Like Zinc finger 10 [Brassica napus]XP_022567392.1 FCS-Like Zinc finger 10 [Brassica napus]KAH0874375.1 hypothetical protein HID58_071737 [Brassica napus]VDD62598.1 unnamed protein product [Brassica oleracea]
MAEADPDSSDSSDLKPNSSAPLFSIPRFFVAKESDAAGRSPTSPLDFTIFGGLFSPRSPPAAPSSPRFRNRWACDKVGLSLLSSSVGEEEGHEEGLFNVVLAPQIKPRLFGSCVKSYSLPKNYAAPSMSSDAVNIEEEHNIHDSEEHNSPRRSSSSPMDIISSQAYSRSLSAREMALSEDYTCIISHGPNPKTTHIFGDCILDCDPKELGTKDETEKPEGDDDSFLCLCTDKPQNHIHMHSETSATAEEKESDKGVVEDCLEISPGTSYNEDLFPMAS